MYIYVCVCIYISSEHKHLPKLIFHSKYTCKLKESKRIQTFIDDSSPYPQIISPVCVLHGQSMLTHQELLDY